MTLKDFTIPQLRRIYAKVYKALERDLKGGLAFGMDWPTVTILYPSRATLMKAIIKEQNRQWMARNGLSAKT